MTREEAIKELQESFDTLREYDIAHSSRLKQALEMAIRTLENHDIFMKRAYSQGKQDALSQEPCDKCRNNHTSICGNCKEYDEFEPCDDAISRSGAIKAIEERAKRIKNEDTLNGLAGAVGILFELPSVTQKSDEQLYKNGFSDGYEQWQELKETIIELRDNDGTATQQEVCKFLANLMDVLEKQTQEQKSGKYCDTCERECPCLYCKHEFEPQESEE